jgi:hypothetical protein
MIPLLLYNTQTINSECESVNEIIWIIKYEWNNVQ